MNLTLLKKVAAFLIIPLSLLNSSSPSWALEDPTLTASEHQVTAEKEALTLPEESDKPVERMPAETEDSPIKSASVETEKKINVTRTTVFNDGFQIRAEFAGIMPDDKVSVQLLNASGAVLIEIFPPRAGEHMNVIEPDFREHPAGMYGFKVRWTDKNGVLIQQATGQANVVTPHAETHTPEPQPHTEVHADMNAEPHAAEPQHSEMEHPSEASHETETPVHEVKASTQSAHQAGFLGSVPAGQGESIGVKTLRFDISSLIKRLSALTNRIRGRIAAFRQARG